MWENIRVYGGLGLRHALTYGSGILVYRGYITAGEGEQLVSVLMFLAGVGLSIAQKIKSQKALASANAASKSSMY